MNISGKLIELLFICSSGYVGVSVARLLTPYNVTIFIITSIPLCLVFGYVGKLIAQISVRMINASNISGSAKVSVAWAVGIVGIICFSLAHGIIDDIRKNVVEKEIASNTMPDNQPQQPIVLPQPVAPEILPALPAAPSPIQGSLPVAPGAAPAAPPRTAYYDPAPASTAIYHNKHAITHEHFSYNGYASNGHKKIALTNGKAYNEGDTLGDNNGYVLKKIHPAYILVRRKADKLELIVPLI